MDTPNVIDIPLETSKVVNVPIVNLIPVNENSNRINVESKKYTEIPTKDIESDGKKNFIDSTSTSFPYKFLQDVSSGSFDIVLNVFLRRRREEGFVVFVALIIVGFYYYYCLTMALFSFNDNNKI